MIKILLAEDDDALGTLVKAYLDASGYEVTLCRNGLDALTELNKSDYAMVITDIMMPVMDGFTLAKRIREQNKTLPLLFMTAKDDKPSQQLGFTLGIDDYIVKPFDLDIFALRVSAILRRTSIENSNLLVVGNLKMDKTEHNAYLDNEELPLTVREFDLLFKFLSYPKRTFTRSALMDEFWDYDSSATSRTVDVYMAKLREKTARCDGFEIVTVHGLGYKAVLK
ncbi:MAG: response regulator transcription factor [Clostridia bacterium]|nr:response regulator transcription factor [Clostridia bacterium]